MSNSAASLNGSATAAVSNWLEWTVREFFTQVNWADQPPEVQAIHISTLEGETPELSLQLSVGQFFSSIPWDGKAVAAPVTETPVMESAPASDSGEIDVDAFADFF